MVNLSLYIITKNAKNKHQAYLMKQEKVSLSTVMVLVILF